VLKLMLVRFVFHPFYLLTANLKQAFWWDFEKRLSLAWE